MTCLLAMTDKVLRESGVFNAQDSEAQMKQAAMFLSFVHRPGLPLYRVVAR